MNESYTPSNMGLQRNSLRSEGTHSDYSSMSERKRGRKPLFSDGQVRVLIEAAKRHLKRFKSEGKGQAELAVALGNITQPSLSNLLRGKWKPGLTTATAIANLDGYASLEDMIGPFGDPPPPSSSKLAGADFLIRFPNLETCIKFYSGRKLWSPWTIAAARAGFFGDEDLAAPEWQERLDLLESSLLTARKKK